MAKKKSDARRAQQQYAVASSAPKALAAEALATEMVTWAIKEFGPTVGRAIYDAWKDKKPTFVQRIESWREAPTGSSTEYFFLRLGFFNLTPHGVYVDEFWAEAPYCRFFSSQKSGPGAFQIHCHHARQNATKGHGTRCAFEKRFEGN